MICFITYVIVHMLFVCAHCVVCVCVCVCVFVCVRVYASIVLKDCIDPFIQHIHMPAYKCLLTGVAGDNDSCIN